MPIWKLQVEWSADSALPRDVFCITPHFNDGGVGSDPQGLCDDLADALVAKTGIITRETRVTAYDAQGTPPVYPAGMAVRNVGQAPSGTVPRELALCLSFYGTRNIPTQRGRLYIPLENAKGNGNIVVRPNAGSMTEVAAFAPIFSDLGGVDVDWCVYSRKLDTAFGITNWWVDDEYDVMRSRGLRPQTRLTGAVSDG